MTSLSSSTRADVRRLIVPGRYANVPIVTNFVAEAASAAGLPEAAVYHCQMAADEAATNVIEHAYGGESSAEIEVTCLVEPGTLTIEIVDQGRPFDPDEIEAPNIGAPLEELKPGGIGLYLMRQYMDEVEFEFADGQNRVTMRKQALHSGGGEGAEAGAPREVEPGIWLARPAGRLDSAHAGAFEEGLLAALEQGARWLVVDFADVPYISSRGLKALVAAWRRAQAASGDVLLCSMDAHVHTVFDTVGFTRLFSIYEDCTEALSSAAVASK